MENHTIKAVIFDLGRVLIDFDHLIAAKKIAPFTDMTPREIYGLFFDSEITVRFEEGRISPEEFFSKVRQMLHLRLDYDAFLPIWNQIFFLTPKNHAVYALAKNLKRKYGLVLLSNVNVLHFEYVVKHFPVFDVFDHIVASYQVGVTKPSPVIYRKALELVSVEPHQAFYTDDRVELVEGARALGIRASVFKDPEQLQQDLAAAGVTLS